MENEEIESPTFRMQSERSANWANSPFAESSWVVDIHDHQ